MHGTSYFSIAMQPTTSVITVSALLIIVGVVMLLAIGVMSCSSDVHVVGRKAYMADLDIGRDTEPKNLVQLSTDRFRVESV